MPLFERRKSDTTQSPSREWRVTPDDRAGKPLVIRRFGFGTLLAAVLIAAGAWFYLDDQAVPRAKSWFSAVTEQAASFVPDRPTATAATPTGGPASRTDPAPRLPPEDARPGSRQQAEAAPSPPAEPAAPSERTPAAAMTAAPAATNAIQAPEPGFNAPYAPARPAVDPLQMRAEAAGLHPEMSKALLARLSEADFKNVSAAIAKALAETRDDDALIWPLKRAAGLAQFRVHFVPGADAECRRYVVTVAKDGWQTTALPMERCGGGSIRSATDR